MKKIHKKIGAVALASMIVAGGFSASKIDSHAALWWGRRPSVVVSGPKMNLRKLSHDAYVDADYLKDYLKDKAKNIHIVAAADGEDAMKDHIKKNYPKNPELLSRVSSYCFYGSDAVGIANAAKSRGEKLVNLKFDDAYVLLSIK